MKEHVRLGVNIDHVATLRQQRGTRYPDPIQAALLAQDAGADGITLHLREDRRHIQDRDVEVLAEVLQVPMNLEMAITADMLEFAERIKPAHCCLVPEKREELTTEGGLDICRQEDEVMRACNMLGAAGIEVSLFINPTIEDIDCAVRCGAPTVEFHTGLYADADKHSQDFELRRLCDAAAYAANLDLTVNAGHGLHYHNVQPVAAIPAMHELNIGHSIIARAMFVGLPNAVREMKALVSGA